MFVLPSKRIVYIGIASVIALGCIIFAVIYGNHKATTANGSQVLASLTPSSAIADSLQYNTDSDNDGLKDWEETLWGTDPHNPDTDGDGTPDGQEIKENRNPLVKGPNDALAVNTAAALSAKTETGKSTQTGTTSDLTLTDQFSQDLFSTYMRMKQSGQEITPEIESQLAQNFLTRSQIETPEEKTYANSDIRINSTESADSIRAYGNTMGSILLKDSPSVDNGSELSILEEAATNKDNAALSKLDPFIAGYKKMISDMLAVRVPGSASLLHLQIVNDVQSLLEDDQKMKQVLSDPILTLSAINNYAQAAQDTFTTFTEVTAYFNTKGVNFSSQDPGFRFVNANG